MTTVNRRAFLKSSSLSALPLLAPALPAFAAPSSPRPAPADRPMNFIIDSGVVDPAEYISTLQQIAAAKPITMDVYGNGGAVEALEKKFMEITGKEKAIFMPTGTMANQLAIHVLSGENAKVFVQETSHVYRDEADAAQTVHNKRLIPVAKGQGSFTQEELQQTVEYHQQGEVFASGIGVVSIENPVRRADGKFIPIEELKKISAYCRKQGYKMHLDGARIHMAATWSGTSIAEYASLFDTVYISLYKYLGASAGAMLCGDKAVIDKMPHLIKIYGGAMFRNWSNAAMALYNLEQIDERLKQVRKRGEELIAMLNQLPEIKITPIPNGTNIYMLQLAKGIDVQQFGTRLAKDYNIRIGRPNETGLGRFALNETVLYQDVSKTFAAFRDALKKQG
jgi:threonine aldolase